MGVFPVLCCLAWNLDAEQVGTEIMNWVEQVKQEPQWGVPQRIAGDGKAVWVRAVGHQPKAALGEVAIDDKTNKIRGVFAFL